MQRSFILAKYSLLDLSSRQKILEILFRNDRHLVYITETRDAIEYSVDLEKLKPNVISEIHKIVNNRYRELCVWA